MKQLQQRQHLLGQSAVEYLVITAAVATALGVGMAGEDGVLRQLLQAMRDAYESFAYALSLP
jgi:hypothetical protein